MKSKLALAAITIFVLLGVVKSSVFFDYGPLAGDNAFWDYDDDCILPEAVTTSSTFNFLGTEYDPNTVTICANGMLCLNATDESSGPDVPFPNATTVPAIFALYCDFITENEDSILYARKETSGTVLDDIDSTITAVNSDYISTAVAFIASFINLEGYYDSNYRGTFQAVLATDDTYTYCILNYIDVSTNGSVAAVGFGNGQGDDTYYNHPWTFSDDLADLVSYSNVGVPGRWIYRVDSSVTADPNDRAITSGTADDDIGQEVAIDLFFDYGILVGDVLVKDDDYYIQVDTSNITVYGEQYFSAYASTNGIITFGDDDDSSSPNSLPNPLPYASYPAVIPFWADLDSEDEYGVTFIRNTDSASDLDAIDLVISAANLPYTATTNAVIATWVGVPQYQLSNTTTGTFQGAVVTDGIYTYAIFHYHELNYLISNRESVAVGFDLADDVNYWLHPLISASTFNQLTTDSNVDVAGRWIYRINDVNITEYDQNVETFVVVLTFSERVYTNDLADPTTAAYQELYYSLLDIILSLCELENCYIRSVIFSSGSVVADFEYATTETLTDENIQSVLTGLDTAVANGDFGDSAITVDLDDDDDDDASSLTATTVTVFAAWFAAMWNGRY